MPYFSFSLLVFVSCPFFFRTGTVRIVLPDTGCSLCMIPRLCFLPRVPALRLFRTTVGLSFATSARHVHPYNGLQPCPWPTPCPARPTYERDGDSQGIIHLRRRGTAHGAVVTVCTRVELLAARCVYPLPYRQHLNILRYFNIKLLKI